jgi:hypothetical protein
MEILSTNPSNGGGAVDDPGAVSDQGEKAGRAF